MKSNYWLFHIYSEGSQQLIVTITPIHYWESDGCISDGFTAEEDGDIGDTLHRLRLHELQESVFEAEGYKNKKELKQTMLDEGFVENAKFNTFCDQYS
jgi:hypothetical protein